MPTIKALSLCLVLIGTLFLTVGLTHAEGNCPAGYYPIGASQGSAGPQGCAPMPGYNRQQQGVSSPTRWTSQWGAFATDDINGGVGVGVGSLSKRGAEKAAIADCESKGGTQCKVRVAYDNECAALVAGKSGYNVSANVTLEEAIKDGMKKCKAATTDCDVYFSSCSLPIRVQ